MNEQKNMVAILKDTELPQIEALISLNAMPGTDVKTMALQELEYLAQIAVAKPDLQQCEPRSVALAVKSVIKNNLSLDQNAGLVYVKTRSVKTAAGWVKVMEIQPSANGLISIARQCGRVLDIKNPVVHKDAHGKVISVEIEILLPSTPKPRWEKRTFDESDFTRWARASHKENRRAYDNAQPQYREGKPVPNNETLNYANPNYTSWKGGIDPEFARAKAVRHGLKKLGTNPNELKAAAITVSEPKKIRIDSEKDQEALLEETDGGYTPHEEVETKNGVVNTAEQVITPKAEPTAAPTQTYTPPSASPFDIPNANDL